MQLVFPPTQNQKKTTYSFQQSIISALNSLLEFLKTSELTPSDFTSCKPISRVLTRPDSKALFLPSSIGRMTPFTSEAGSNTSSTPFSTHLEAEQRQMSLTNFAIPNTEFQSVKAEEPSRVSSERAPLTERPSVQTAYRSATSRSTSEYRRQTTAIDCIRVYQAGTPIETSGLSIENDYLPPVKRCYKSIMSDDGVLADMMTKHLRATTFFKNAHISSTLQLVYCITLLLNSSESSLHGEGVQKPVDLSEDRWLRGAKEDPEIQKYLCSLTSMMVKVFVDARSQCPDLIAEIVLLGPVLNPDDYHTLLSYVIDTLNLSYWQNIEYLRGMIQLVQSASPGVLADGHVDKILTAIREHLQKTMKEVHHLVSAVMKVLEVMARGMVKDLDRQRDYRPLLDVLQATSDKDESLKFQVECARQACLYLSADETPLRNVQCSALLETDVGVVITELDRAPARGIAGSTETDTVKEAWYPALQTAGTFVQHGRLVEFGQLVRGASCRYVLNFRRGVCQIIGKIAIDPLWTVANRQSAIDCLGGLYRLHGTDVDFETDHNIRPSIVAILRHISSMEQSDIKKYAHTILSDLPGRESCILQDFHPWMTRLPLPPFYRLLCRAQAIPQEESRLEDLRRARLQECFQPLYITPQVTTSSDATRDTPCSLATTMQGFLKSDRLVHLLLGESGSGKTLSCQHLERKLWRDYNNGGVIPIYIDLSYINTPEYNLIETQLHLHDFSNDEIQQLLQHRRFVIICDGYDVRRLTKNLYNTNQLGRRDVKMVISCRSTFLPSDYQGRFRPHGPSHYCNNSADFYEESTIAPLSESDIKKFIQQYVRHIPVQEPLGKLHLSIADDYWNALTAIPNMVNVIENPFLLTLALKNLPSLSHDALDPTRRETTRDQLYNNFVNGWIDANKKRLDSATLNQESLYAYELLCDSNFRWCVRDFLKRFATAMRKHQKNRLVVKYIERKDKDSWKADFLGRAIEATLLREASPLTKTGILHRFLYDSLFVFFRFLAAYDPFEDEDDSNDSDDDDSFDGQDGFHGDGGASFHGDANALADGNAGLSGGSGGSTNDNNRSSDGNDRSSGGNDGSIGGNGDSTSGRGDCGDGRGATGNGGSSGGGKDASEGDKDGSRRPKDISRFKKKGRSNKSLLPKSSDLFSDENYLDDLEVLELLVERARADSWMRKCLFTVIEKSKLSTTPSLAAANSITILFKAGERFRNIDLNDVRIPSDYILKEALEFIETDLATMLSGLIVPTNTLVRSSCGPERGYTKRLCLDASSLRLEGQMASPVELQLQELRNHCLQEELPPENYIAPFGRDTVDAFDSSASPLLPTVMDFLKGEQQVLLVMGDAGSGKTHFLRQLERELWGKYTGSAEDAIPILFDLSRIEKSTPDLLVKALTCKGFSEEQVHTLNHHSRQFVLICDGYDEAQVEANIYDRDNFNKVGHGRVKLIIACRSQRESDGFFQPETGAHHSSKKLDRFQKVAMAPFTYSMIEEYVMKYVVSPSHLEVQLEAPQSSQSSPAWSVQQYMVALNEIPNLMELVGNPFILSVVLHLLPTLTSPAHDFKSHISFDTIYRRVFENWMEVNKRRLHLRENLKYGETASRELLGRNFAAECLGHMKNLAVETFQNERKDPLSIQNTIDESFEYLYSLLVFDPEGSDEGDLDTDGSGPDGFDPDGSTRSAEPLHSKSGGGQWLKRGRALQEQQQLERGQALKEGHALGFTNISERPMAVQFLADRVQIHQFFKEQLVATVRESRSNKGIDQTLAANTMTILVRSGMRFNGADLRGIKIMGANLTGGEFDFADLRDSDLRNVTFDK
ncbi:hypothetical protein BGZ91_005354, partial [Linnemannia elongata]